MIVEDLQPGRATAQGVRFRAAVAVALPLVLLLITRLFDLDPLYHFFVSGTPHLLTGIAIVWGLVLVECRCMATLARLVRTRGDLEATVTMERDPSLALLRRRRRFRIAGVALSVALALGVSELFFRVLNIQPADPLPSPFFYWDEVDNTVNALGLREPWETLPDDDDRLRILFLGDSVTYGHGVQREESFCALAEPMLEPFIPRGVVTINAGVSGFSPHEEREFYVDIREAIKPDLVVQVVYLNDFGIDLTHMLDMIYRVRDSYFRISEYSYVIRFAERQVRYWLAWKYTRDYFRGGRTHGERQKAWKQFEHDLTRCIDVIRADGVAYALILFPVIVELDNYPFADMHEQMVPLAARLGIPFLDLLPVYEGRDALSLRVAPTDEHPNAEGHHLAANRIVEFLRDEVLPSLPLEPPAVTAGTDDTNQTDGV